MRAASTALPAVPGLAIPGKLGFVMKNGVAFVGGSPP
jgi:hypothetical protein